jgi:hypothetical protein
MTYLKHALAALGLLIGLAACSQTQALQSKCDGGDQAACQQLAEKQSSGGQASSSGGGGGGAPERPSGIGAGGASPR